jgi:hypothetical protein
MATLPRQRRIGAGDALGALDHGAREAARLHRDVLGEEPRDGDAGGGIGRRLRGQPARRQRLLGQQRAGAEGLGGGRQQRCPLTGGLPGRRIGAEPGAGEHPSPPGMKLDDCAWPEAAMRRVLAPPSPKQASDLL